MSDFRKDPSPTSPSSEGVENLLCDNVARSTSNSLSRPCCCSQHKEMRDCSRMTRLTRQRAEEIALGQVVRSPVGVARSLIRTKQRQGIGGNHRMTDDSTGNVRNMLAHNIDHSLSKAF